ncbi:hypothetical protein SAMN05428975_0982 [Mucilaginibacter sp. OK268]|nr:hypothetical protein SAMN05428975_0982 [Mucilaginibacter sp. OK268]
MQGYLKTVNKYFINKGTPVYFTKPGPFIFVDKLIPWVLFI